jgi:Flp pilus assembly pilin Flp
MSDRTGNAVRRTMTVRSREALLGRWLGFRARLEDETGAIAAEYVLLLTLIAIALIGAMTGLGFAISAKYQTARDCIAGLPGPC